ncbi:Periostin [Cladorrhinum samala]|uniref:Periostin n=1 Tax=Cladorrhinum samala TaxID=585594 RepID=A0AAV9I0S9_9PEZI|nr:Periostin [Cladorrhinum samala]
MIFWSSSRRSSSSLGLPNVLLAVFSAFVPALVTAVDLDSVLSKQTNLTIFNDLVKTHPDIFAKLPNTGVTILAPNDYAFSKLGVWDTQMRHNATLVAAILRYHIIPKPVRMTSIVKGESVWSSTLLTDPAFSTVKGGQHLIMTKQPDGKVVFASGYATRGTVLAEDLAFDGGLVQVIDSVMRVPEDLELTTRNAYTDITAFLGALFATGLMGEVVEKQTDLTIFAPRNSAFQQLAGTFAGLSNADLKKILSYHIIPRSVMHVWELKNDTSLTTAEGSDSKVGITLFTNFIYVNSAQLIQTDVLLNNGVVHIIDNVLDYNQAGARPDVSQATQSPVFKVAGTQTETGTALPTPFTSYIPCTTGCPAPGAATPTTEAGKANGDDEEKSSSNAGLAGARCTGLAGAGVGVGLAVGALMIGL